MLIFVISSLFIITNVKNEIKNRNNHINNNK